MRLAFLAACLLSATPAAPPGLHFVRGHRAEIETTVAGDMPLFEVRIEGRTERLWFLIDTGSSYTILDTRAARGMAIDPVRTDSVRGAGGGEVKVGVVDGVTFVGPGFTTAGHEVRLADLAGIEELIGHRVDGFFGYDFLARAVVTFDPGRRRIVLADPAHAEPRPAGTVLPLRFGGRNGRWVYVPATIKVPGQPPEVSEFFVDSGSGDAVNHPLLRKSTGPLRTIQSGRGLGSAGGDGVAGTVEWLRLGPLTLTDLPGACCGPLEGTERQIGQGVLSKFVVTYDYSCRRMTVER